ncbi:polysaccharide pyruvyl transferase CsaB [Bacillaceae bacterium]
MKPKHVVLSGYYGFANAGDEAICASIVQSLKEIDPRLTITVLSGNPAQTRRELEVQAVERTNLRKIWQTLKSADLLISGGGSLLQDKTGSLTIPYYLGIVHLAKWAGVPVAVYAQGIGPVQKKLFQKWIAALFRQLDYLSVRDEHSKRLLSDWGVPAEKIEEVVDPVFLLKSNGPAAGKALLAAEGIALAKPPVLFSVRRWQEGAGDANVFAEVCDRLLADGEEIVFVPFHHPADREASREIAALLKGKAHILERAYTPAQLLDIVSAGKAMVGMRLHALIFAAARAIPCIGVSYDPKIDAFLRQLNDEPAGRSGRLSAETLYEKVKATLAREAEIREELADKNKALREKAKRPAQQVAALLSAKRERFSDT